MTQKKLKQEVIEQMKSLGTYKPEYKATIEVYSDMLFQYKKFNEEFKKQGYLVETPYTNKAGATNLRKTPVYSALERLRIDLTTYTNLLGLNPKSLQNIPVERSQKSSLATILDELDSKR